MATLVHIEGTIELPCCPPCEKAYRFRNDFLPFLMALAIAATSALVTGILSLLFAWSIGGMLTCGAAFLTFAVVGATIYGIVSDRTKRKVSEYLSEYALPLGMEGPWPLQ